MSGNETLLCPTCEAEVKVTEAWQRAARKETDPQRWVICPKCERAGCVEPYYGEDGNRSPKLDLKPEGAINLRRRYSMKFEQQLAELGLTRVLSMSPAITWRIKGANEEEDKPSSLRRKLLNHKKTAEWMRTPHPDLDDMTPEVMSKRGLVEEQRMIAALRDFLGWEK